MFEADTIYAKIAYEAILVYLKSGTKITKDENEIPPALKLKLACFVSIHEQNGELRGCIGTSKPKKEHLYQEIIDNATAAASEDPRFSPLKEEELNNITVSVDVLSSPKPVEDINLLKPHKHGVIVNDNEGREALLLPNLDGIDSTEKQLELAKKKAGINPEISNSELSLKYFTTTRYK
jgi:hypothetical protein